MRRTIRHSWQAPRSPSWWQKLILHGFLALFFCIGAGLLYGISLRPLGLYLEARTWTPTPCEIVDREFAYTGLDFSGGADPTSGELFVEYRYTWHGVSLTSTRYALSGHSGLGFFTGRHQRSRFSPGQTTHCFVDPREPHRAVLDRSLPGGVFLFPFAFFFMGIGFLPAFARRQRAYFTSGSYPEAQPLPLPLAGVYWRAFGLCSILCLIIPIAREVLALLEVEQSLASLLLAVCLILLGFCLFRNPIGSLLLQYAARLLLRPRLTATSIRTPIGWQTTLAWEVEKGARTLRLDFASTIHRDEMAPSCEEHTLVGTAEPALVHRGETTFEIAEVDLTEWRAHDPHVKRSVRLYCTLPLLPQLTCEYYLLLP